ncbi:AIPR family protein [Brevibacterium zhoupengii]|uniref:AIPR family protein n=1 Tax=Brevibacterium zhoupengii TaxID=2898795 RepID=UPI001E5F8C71|nr:AIPR family protein [Brevibacterium zhoupengii]
MSDNDVLLLSGMIDKSRQETNELSSSEQEAYFFSKHYLKYYKPSHDDVQSGIVDGTLDGGVDAVYVFGNGYCLRDDIGADSLGRSPQLDLILVQVKNTKGFGESAIDKLIINLPKLLDFRRDDSALSEQFNPKVLEVTRRFLELYRSMDMPALRIFVAFASLKSTEFHPNVNLKTKELERVLIGCFGSSETQVQLLDAAAISDLARDRPPVTVNLTLAENPISTDISGGYVGLVRLEDYQDFITDNSGNLDAGLFEANVRDYEIESEVNKSIQGTLEHEDRVVDFWWLNNGVTIVADKVQLAGKNLSLESPQIVNGLQTSHEIYKRGRSQEYSENRGVLVKVIQAGDDEIKDRIIRATNSQTTLGLSSLRATDRVQREIEEILRAEGLYYERRKNYYQNQNVPIVDLVSIDQMGQAVMAVLVQTPEFSRGSVSRIFEDEIYNVVFSAAHPIRVYARSISIVRTCESYLRDNRTTQAQVEDFVFHLSMAAGIALTRKLTPRAKDIGAIDQNLNDELLGFLVELVQDEFGRTARATNEVLFDRLAKNPLATTQIKKRMGQYLASSRKI